MSTSLLLAKVCVLGVLAGYLPLFLGVRKYRRFFAILLVTATAGLIAFSAVALQTTLDIGRFTSRPALLAAAAVGLLVLIAIGSWAAYRWPAWAVPVMLAVMPIRIPVSAGGSSANLLVPLYLVIVCVLIAEVVVRDRLRPPPGRATDPLRISLAVLIALAGISVFWIGRGYGSHAIGAGWPEQSLFKWLIEFFAFYAPFGLVLSIMWRYVTTSAGLRRALLTIIGSGVVFAVIGAIQYPTRWIFFNRASLLGDYRLGHGLRVNSLFYDPNMFSRTLIMVIILSVALMVAMPAWRRRLAGVAFLAAAVNLLTLSRSGWIALAVGLVVFAFAWLGRRRGFYVAGAALAVVVVALGLVIGVRGIRITNAKLSTPWGWNHLTGGRYFLWEGALKMARDHPLEGVGLAGFQIAYQTNKYRDHNAYKKLTASHTTPLTMAAELGIPGLLAYIAVVWTALSAAFRRKGAVLVSAPARAGPLESLKPASDGMAGSTTGARSEGLAFAVAGTPGRPENTGRAASGPDADEASRTAAGASTAEISGRRALYLVRAGLGSVVVAMVVHSLLYNAFFEDPYLWAIFGMIVAAAYRLTSWQPGAPSSRSDAQ